jgi:hypothetical protein
MTEVDWVTSPEIGPLINWLYFKTQVSDRKLRLFSVECARPVLIHLGHFAESATRLLSLTEVFADGELPPHELNQPRQELLNAWREYDQECVFGNRGQGGELSVEELELWAVANYGVNAVVGGTLCAEERDQPDSQYRQRGFSHAWLSRAFPSVAAAEATAALVEAGDWMDGIRNEVAQYQRRLLHDIMGNPFHPVSCNPEWRTCTVVALANQMYNSRDFSAIPILADALEDAGCTEADILGHLRGPGPHVRGCWVLDLLLDKK